MVQVYLKRPLFSPHPAVLLQPLRQNIALYPAGDCQPKEVGGDLLSSQNALTFSRFHAF